MQYNYDYIMYNKYILSIFIKMSLFNIRIVIANQVGKSVVTS